MCVCVCSFIITRIHWFVTDHFGISIIKVIIIINIILNTMKFMTLILMHSKYIWLAHVKFISMTWWGSWWRAKSINKRLNVVMQLTFFNIVLYRCHQPLIDFNKLLFFISKHVYFQIQLQWNFFNLNLNLLSGWILQWNDWLV